MVNRFWNGRIWSHSLGTDKNLLAGNVKPGQMHRHCLANISNSACQACLSVWPPQQTLLNKHILLVNSICQARVCVVAKTANIVLDKQNFIRKHQADFLEKNEVFYKIRFNEKGTKAVKLRKPMKK